MNRFPLTTDGVAAFCTKVYNYDDSRLQSTAGEAAADPRAFLASRFELPVEQMEFIRCLDAAFMQVFGWGLATALIGRMPISYKPVLVNLKGGQKNGGHFAAHKALFRKQHNGGRKNYIPIWLWY